MKHIFFSFGLLALHSLVYAKPVSIQTAQTVATNFMNQHGMRSGTSMQLSSTYPLTATTVEPLCYIFNAANNNGFVIVAADDAVKPVLAYSTENAFPAHITNREVIYWLDGYCQQINAVVTHLVPATDAITNAWTSLLNINTDDGNTAAKPTGIAPLINTQWDQWNSSASGPTNELYNNLCPALTPTGCVATAMAQIMKYWDHPTMGTGSHSYNSNFTSGVLSANFGATTYDWANMPNTLTNASSSIQKNAIALLMYHCGISVDMAYNTAQNGGSGSYVVATGSSASSQSAMPAYFNYKSTIQGSKRIDYSDTQWVKLLKFELDNGRPVLYTGYGTGGHAFDFDGYDDNGNFHINWGWSGLANGYYTVDNLNPTVLGTGGSSGNYNYNQAALLMIEPVNSILPPNPVNPDYPPIIDNGLSIADSVSQSSDSIVYNTAYSISTKIQNRSTTDTFKNKFLGIAAISYTNTSSYVILNSVPNVSIIPGAIYNYNFVTAGMANLPVGKYQVSFYYTKNSGTIPDLVGDSLWFNGKTLWVLPAPLSIGKVATLNADKIVTYPNPANDFITIDWKALNAVKVKGIELYNILGQRVAQYKVSNNMHIQLPLTGFRSGIYFIQVNTDKGNIPKKITIQR